MSKPKYESSLFTHHVPCFSHVSQHKIQKACSISYYFCCFFKGQQQFGWGHGTNHSIWLLQGLYAETGIKAWRKKKSQHSLALSSLIAWSSGSKSNIILSCFSVDMIYSDISVNQYSTLNSNGNMSIPTLPMFALRQKSKAFSLTDSRKLA